MIAKEPMLALRQSHFHTLPHERYEHVGAQLERSNSDISATESPKF
jgi:hypothetical protein